ncbi:hypothetical protein COCC4DRAFT_186001 [Bipolaris maydis ATCC 48331]|uniref:RING-type E3 ubiquitin transferase n=2 Tax=Cochliobolus heterostrophus TaxID=5016 RepID=M2U788_COCH5|nr:uncharacterized protein COCC4DRAFT_186001 [Bipolaris maydis ATCC 48331]EMD89636.1 hypothetical protein COCHEDRAFT_1177372 [Bipolaris maydis C5]ENI10152.1 hypothetical protein COCC4DRAFT_186001 [Bipolaris maydis ATCC 48331]KAJ6207478.1 RING-9 protein [Bipolaris maydis]KAJ6269863.1 hypothetical protein PSV08DRAFT_205138 [Bipolaris maydis]
MRPLRLIVSLSTSLAAFTIVLYMVLGNSVDAEQGRFTSTSSSGGFKALFSFASPGSLFPPSAIISLTDDNSTFFLARPAAFGPSLPKEGLSGALWVGSGFDDDTIGAEGELGCSDVPGWHDNGDDFITTPQTTANAKNKLRNTILGKDVTPKDGVPESRHDSSDDIVTDDGTDDHLQPHGSKAHAQPGGLHADIQSLQESAEIIGKIVLLKRGGCGFLAKVQWAQSRGGIAVIVGDDVRGGALVRMYAKGDTSNITIPSLFTSHTTAHLLSSLIPNERVLTGAAQNSQNYTQKESRPAAHNKKYNQKTPKGTTATFQTGWLHSFMALFRAGSSENAHKAESRRPPTDGNVEWLEMESLDNDDKPIKTKSVAPSSILEKGSNDAKIGGQDWRVPNTLPQTSANEGQKAADPTSMAAISNGNELPTSDEYINTQVQHKGLWVTLTPTNVSSSPFFDTLLVLVVSPLVTLTVVYVLLLLRSRIRRRRWRAPKSVVERLPVRTYQTISDSPSSSAASLPADSPTTPLLQPLPSRSRSLDSRSRSSSDSDVPGASSSMQHGPRGREQEKRESGLAAWRRRYGGRQKECVVCLEEYVDGVSQVMSLPCGHEFHADCITPWLVTRRRTCPICKGDVVRSLSWRHDQLQSASPTRSSQPPTGGEDVQTQAAESHDMSPSASRPVPTPGSAQTSPRPTDDVEAGWTRDDSYRSPVSSLRELASSVSTVVWRGFDAVRNTTGFQRSPPEDVDRNR